MIVALPKSGESELLCDRFLVVQVGKETFTALKTHLTRPQIHKMRINFAHQGHEVNHFTEHIYYTTKADLNLLPRKLRSPLEERTRASGGRGR